jgi:hypothetical protein
MKESLPEKFLIIFSTKVNGHVIEIIIKARDLNLGDWNSERIAGEENFNFFAM